MLYKMTTKVPVFLLGLILSLFITLSPQYVNGETSLTSNPATWRIAGQNRVETAAKVAKKGWPTGAATILLVSGDDFPDALAGAPLAKKYNAPVLLTDSKTLSSETKKAIEDLKPSQAIILGGTAVVSEEIADKLDSKHIRVIRLAGSDRFQTAAMIAEFMGNVDKAVIAYGYNFPDALAISPLAASKGIPILLTDSTSIPQSTLDTLNKLQVRETFVIGGSRVISDTVLAQLPGAQRIAGEDRYATVLEILKNPEFQCNMDEIYLATGENFPDALAGSVLAAKNNNPIFLVDNPLTLRIADFITAHADTIKSITTLGGPSVVPDASLHKLQWFVKTRGQVLSIPDNFEETTVAGISLRTGQDMLLDTLGMPTNTKAEEIVAVNDLYYGDDLVVNVSSYAEGYVCGIALISSKYHTNRGVTLGDSQEMVKRLYGEPVDSGEDYYGTYYQYNCGNRIYPDPNLYWAMRIFFTNGKVSRIIIYDTTWD